MEKNLFLKKMNKKINIVEDIIRPSIIIKSNKSLLNRELSLNQLIEFNESKKIKQNIFYKHPLQSNNNSCFFEKIIKLTNNKKFDIKNTNNKTDISKIYKKKVLSFSFSKPKFPKNYSTLTNNNSNSTINTTINNNLYLINNNESSSCKNSNSQTIENIINKDFKTYSKNNNNKLLSEKKFDFEKINQISLTIKTNKMKYNKLKKYNLEFNYFRNKEKNITNEKKESEDLDKQLKSQKNLNLQCNLENKFKHEKLNLFTPKNKRNNNLKETKKSLTNQSKKNINYKYDFSFNFFKRNNEK